MKTIRREHAAIGATQRAGRIDEPPHGREESPDAALKAARRAEADQVRMRSPRLKPPA